MSQANFKISSACNFQLSDEVISSGTCIMLLQCKPGSCFKAGTEILMANNELKTIDTIIPCNPASPNSGDSVITAAGQVAHVIGIVKSAPNTIWPLIRIVASSETDEGNQAQETYVTHNHAMALSNGNLIPAGFLRPGDKLSSINYEAVVDELEYISDSTESVWNMWLAPEDYIKNELPKYSDNPARFYGLLFNAFRHSLFGASPKQHLVYANGLVSGDFSLQYQLHQALRAGIATNLCS
jgi:hypothetical protein